MNLSPSVLLVSIKTKTFVHNFITIINLYTASIGFDVGTELIDCMVAGIQFKC